MPRVLFGALCLAAAALIFALGYLIGAGQGLDLMRQQAVDEGFAVREGEAGFRWRTSDEITRRPARREGTNPH